jgi:3-isopropylmalate/(R)-2-methylmalate dehydratase small subunit
MMEPFIEVDSVAVPLGIKNVDTDQLIPARFLWRPRSEGYSDQLLHDHRFASDGTPIPSFVLNKPEYKGSKILIADRNFGCGSSRENAVWALYDYGFRVVIAPSFGDIFFNSSFKNGLLPIILPDDHVDRLRGSAESDPGAHILVDLPAQRVRGPAEQQYSFSVDPFRKELLIAGLDELFFTQRHLPEIGIFETGYDRTYDWL